MKKFNITFLILGILIIASGCSQKPAEIHYGQDECAHCKMMITDGRFAAQAVTETGKSIKFDSIECLAKYTGDHKSELENARLWVSDFSQPETWVSIENAQLIRSQVIKSPMGASLLAFASAETAEKHVSEYPGKKVSWDQLVK